MKNLLLPNRVTIRLVDRNNCPVELPDILFSVSTFARRKNDFCLQPFASDLRGIVTITKKDLEAEAAAHHDAGLMDYGHIGECLPSVEIRMLSECDIDRAIEARKVWKNLLAGERDRWSSVEQLLTLYRNAENGKLLADRSQPIRDDWNEDGAEYSYDFVVVPK
ncbi:MAG: hypothetical protein HY234_00965 [Acidobacteria bacterium]|nr:hypothetical protein [Acidobacteriota bacterium]MBI3661610.1 hypothetical protein [Acidobacteriota bacterium]